MIKVLVVDDNLIELELLSEALNHHSISCHTASDPHSALSEAQKYKPDIIILDLNMPGMSGMELCKRIKTNASTLHIPIMFLTSDETTESIISGIHLGVIDYLHKPVTPEQLVSAILAQEASKQLRNVLEPLQLKAIELARKYENHTSD